MVPHHEVCKGSWGWAIALALLVMHGTIKHESPDKYLDAINTTLPCSIICFGHSHWRIRTVLHFLQQTYCTNVALLTSLLHVLWLEALLHYGLPRNSIGNAPTHYKSALRARRQMRLSCQHVHVLGIGEWSLLKERSHGVALFGFRNLWLTYSPILCLI